MNSFIGFGGLVIGVNLWLQEQQGGDAAEDGGDGADFVQGQGTAEHGLFAAGELLFQHLVAATDAYSAHSRLPWF